MVSNNQMRSVVERCTMESERTGALRVLIADDHPLVREGLAGLLVRYDMLVVAQARNGEEAVRLHREHKPDVTIMDLRMPKMDGLTALRLILKEAPQARIVVLTSFDGEEQNCLHAGAKALLLKEAPSRELIATIRKVAQAS